MTDHLPRAVMASRAEPAESLDFFPTPPWATRALIQHVLRDALAVDPGDRFVWEPAAGEGHMAGPLREAFGGVFASDIHDYGRRFAVGDFTATLDPVRCPTWPDWIITNPPFNHAEDFALRALDEATEGVALLVRLAWIEGSGRYERLFRPRPPLLVAQFVERVPMVRGRWDPEGSTSTAYAWVVWSTKVQPITTRLMWIPPGCRDVLAKPDDAARYGLSPAAGDAGPLFGGETT